MALCVNGVVREATKKAGVSHAMPWIWRQDNATFAQLETAAREIGADALVKAAHKRAVEGLVRKKFTKDGLPLIDPATGEQYVEREYSDALLMFLLKGALPRTYRENISAELSGPGGGAIPVQVYLPQKDPAPDA